MYFEVLVKLLQKSTANKPRSDAVVHFASRQNRIPPSSFFSNPKLLACWAQYACPALVEVALMLDRMANCRKTHPFPCRHHVGSAWCSYFVLPGRHLERYWESKTILEPTSEADLPHSNWLIFPSLMRPSFRLIGSENFNLVSQQHLIW